VTTPLPEEPSPTANDKPAPLLDRIAVALLGPLFLAWPAIYNGFPLLYPDSMTYLDSGRTVARALFLHRFAEYYGERSPFYALGILPFHWNVNVWPVVLLQCLLVAYVLWLVVRSVSPRRTASRYLILMAALGLLSGVSWYSSFIMPDILGPVLYLCIYLLVFAGETLSPSERASLYPIGWWGVAAHSTHLLLAAGLCVLLAFYALLNRQHRRRHLVGVAEAVAIVVLAAVSQMALNGYLFGAATLNGERPPYLMARIVADGTGRKYLQTHCADRCWTLCSRLGELTDDADRFLWAADGVYQQASDEEAQRMRKEEMPFVLATIRAYPLEQLARSAGNFRDQLFAFKLYGFAPNAWMLDQFATVLPAQRAAYLRSRQARAALPLEFLSVVQLAFVAASLAAIAATVALFWRRLSPRIAGLGLIVSAIVVANALLAGVLSMVDDRYGCRVIWLIPLLSGMVVLDWLQSRERVDEIPADEE
jgi:hypothetical protein